VQIGINAEVRETSQATSERGELWTGLRAIITN